MWIIIKVLPNLSIYHLYITYLSIKVTIGNNQRLVSQDDDNSDMDYEEEDGGAATRRQPAPEHLWSSLDTGMVGSKVPDYERPILDVDRQAILDGRKSAYDYYKLYQPSTFAEEIVYQSRQYAVQKDIINSHLITLDNLRCTEAALLLSGYHSPPRRRMMWEVKGDCYNTLVATNIRRDTVDTIMKSLHFTDNTLIENSEPDIYYKVRPIFNNLNKHGHWMRDLSSTGRFSVDEVMIPYYGRDSTKQYNREKPIRYGYKVIQSYSLTIYKSLHLSRLDIIFFHCSLEAET